MASRATKSLYDTDFAEWSARTAALIRSGRFNEIDAESVAEEIEDLGKSERSAAWSHLSRLLLHKIKQVLQPERDCDRDPPTGTVSFRPLGAPQPFAPAQDQTGPPAGTGLCQLVGLDHKLPSGDPAPDPVITQSAAVHPTEPSGDIPGCLGACADRNRAGACRGSSRVPLGPRYVAARGNCSLLGAAEST